MESDRDLERCRKRLTEQFDTEKQELEEYYAQMLENQKADFCGREGQIKKEFESQINQLMARNNALKGENNLLTIKVSKMMDMLAECTAEASLQEAEIVQANNSAQNSGRNGEYDDNEDGGCGYIYDCCD